VRCTSGSTLHARTDWQKRSDDHTRVVARAICEVRAGVGSSSSVKNGLVLIAMELRCVRYASSQKSCSRGALAVRQLHHPVVLWVGTGRDGHERTRGHLETSR
jgi:hypothetical protein